MKNGNDYFYVIIIYGTRILMTGIKKNLKHL